VRSPQLINHVAPQARNGGKRAGHHCAALAESARRHLEKNGAAERWGEEEVHSIKLQNCGGGYGQ
jgi:hypothetical protein